MINIDHIYIRSTNNPLSIFFSSFTITLKVFRKFMKISCVTSTCLKLHETSKGCGMRVEVLILMQNIWFACLFGLHLLNDQKMILLSLTGFFYHRQIFLQNCPVSLLHWDAKGRFRGQGIEWLANPLLERQKRKWLWILWQK